jgi:uncharacterized protein YndB with AHSA1/START domain
MKNTGTLKVTTPSPREIVLTRVFDAPCTMVYDALTAGTAEALVRTEGLVAGGLRSRSESRRKWHFVLQGPGGQQMGMRGVYRELLRPERTVHTESFDDYPGESIVTGVLVERGRKTTLTGTVLYESQEIRDAVIKSGMEHGAAETYDKLAELLTIKN